MTVNYQLYLFFSCTWLKPQTYFILHFLYYKLCTRARVECNWMVTHTSAILSGKLKYSGVHYLHCSLSLMQGISCQSNILDAHNCSCSVSWEQNTFVPNSYNISHLIMTSFIMSRMQGSFYHTFLCVWQIWGRKYFICFKVVHFHYNLPSFTGIILQEIRLHSK